MPIWLGRFKDGVADVFIDLTETVTPADPYEGILKTYTIPSRLRSVRVKVSVDYCQLIGNSNQGFHLRVVHTDGSTDVVWSSGWILEGECKHLDYEIENLNGGDKIEFYKTQTVEAKAKNFIVITYFK